MDIIVNGIYQHYKGGLYKVIGIASHSETLEKLVIYISLTNHLLWARPLSMWCEEICIDDAIYPRFTYIGDKDEKNTFYHPLYTLSPDYRWKSGFFSYGGLSSLQDVCVNIALS